MVLLQAFSSASAPASSKRPRGRPRKDTITLPRPKRKIGRPRKNPVQVPAELEDSKAGILPSQDPLAAEFWVSRGIQGDQPAFSDWSKRAVDKARNKVYVYGGRPVGQEYSQPDLYCCEVANKMTWVNLTDQLKFCNAYADPFTDSYVMPRPQRLPCLFSPAIAFMTFKGGNYLMLFGGLDEGSDDNRVTDTLLAIDVDKLLWFSVPVCAEPGSDLGPPRMNAAMVAVGEQLFIFSGRSSINCEDGLSSYSIIAHNDDRKWTWKVPECPYPPHLPSLGYDPQVVATYGGLKPINIQPKNMVFFHTSNLLFSLADGVSGNSLPSDLAWYHSFLLNPRPPLPSRKNIDANVANIETPSVLICGWRILEGVNPDESEKLSIELWRYKLTPEDTIECLNVSDKTKNFQKQDFEDAILVGDRLYLLGSEKTGSEWDNYEGNHHSATNVTTDGGSPAKSMTRTQVAGGGNSGAGLVDEMDVDSDEEEEEEPAEPRWYNVRMEVPLW